MGLNPSSQWEKKLDCLGGIYSVEKGTDTASKEWVKDKTRKLCDGIMPQQAFGFREYGLQLFCTKKKHDYCVSPKSTFLFLSMIYTSRNTSLGLIQVNFYFSFVYLRIWAI